MFTDAARAASAQVRAAGAAGAGANVVQQGAAAQASFRAAAGPSRGFAYGGGGKGKGGKATSGGAARGGAAPAAPAAHTSGVAAVARSMGGNASQMDTRPDRTRIDQLKASSTPAAYQTDRNSNAIDGAASRTSAGSMVGDHTTPPQLQKYLD